MAAGPAYKALQKSARAGLSSEAATRALIVLVRESLADLEGRDRVDLHSTVPGKEYFAFRGGSKLTRPVRRDRFEPQEALDNISAFIDGSYTELPQAEIQRLLYTLAMSYCCAAGLTARDDRKTPATFFEYLIGNIFARRLGVNPRNQVEVLNLDMRATLPTDFIFDLGLERRRVHVPVKISTRERVVQVWAHQRVLDGVYGVGRFRGVLVVLTETKLDAQPPHEVIEICLPEQWKVYQMFIAQLFRVYYLDVPRRYANLGDEYPHIEVKPLSEFFAETAAITV